MNIWLIDMFGILFIYVLHRSFLGHSSFMLDEFPLPRCLCFETFSSYLVPSTNISLLSWSHCKETTETAVASSKGANGASKGMGAKIWSCKGLPCILDLPNPTPVCSGKLKIWRLGFPSLKMSYLFVGDDCILIGGWTQQPNTSYITYASSIIHDHGRGVWKMGPSKIILSSIVSICVISVMTPPPSHPDHIAMRLSDLASPGVRSISRRLIDQKWGMCWCVSSFAKDMPQVREEWKSRFGLKDLMLGKA